MDFQTSVKTCFQKYATFSGRAARSEFWWFTLFIMIASIALSILDIVLFGLETISPINSLFGLATLLPGLAVTARRLHDVDRSAWWILLVLIPVVGWLVLLYWEVSKGTDGPNSFGADPLGGSSDDDGHGYASSSIPRAGH